MKLQKGDIYICLEPSCGAEIGVRRGANDACSSKFTLRCCCGKEMTREDMLEHVDATRSVRSAEYQPSTFEKTSPADERGRHVWMSMFGR